MLDSPSTATLTHSRLDSYWLLIQRVASRKAKLNRFFQLFFLLLIPLLTGCEGRKTIVNGLDEKEANEIVVYLASRGFDAQKVKAEAAGTGQGPQLFDINVKETEATQTMAILNQAGLPRRRGQNLLGIFQNTGLVPTEMTEKIRYQAGLAEQIASTIRKFDGVLDAEVQISFPEEDPLNPGKTKGDITASVYVKHSGALDDPNAHAQTKIKRLVASSITGLKYDNVTLVFDKARMNDIQGQLSSSSEDQKQYVIVWSIVIGKESVTKFRVIFFTFSVLLLLILLLMVWIIWKTYPLLQAHGGLKELIHLKPIKTDKKKEDKPKDDAAGKKNPEAKKEGEANAEADFEGEIEFEEEGKK
ncbi:type III secretion system inner membrane ring lipoprotein SctJ [Estrella lausannensis]|uniref:Type III secretion lipoprotein SctJ n=1 Tax=Estrella lausannensis TaxID=483423 RepID=A0A0H5DMZ1_9BACT|nr:type III secretion inner membrane ring lipoprotein SctJ [Estrella lausannensis]CRX37382.1 Type III secretion lipoprotein SctJ [Estrella lausannensis]